MDYKRNYALWLASHVVDEKTKKELSSLDEKEIEDRFWRELEFGTGGLRGVMGTGTNRMNIYTVRQATQGLADYISATEGGAERGVVIAYDSRNNSRLFACECARVLSANGIKNYIFPSLRPTPMLSFAVRYLGCTAGVVITASHNPAEYNGYKVYGDDGCQIGPETAAKILKNIRNTDIFDGIKLTDTPDTVILGAEVDDAYIAAVKAESLGTKIPAELSVVYTPLHGAGNLPVRRVLSEIGVKNLTVVAEQEAPNGDFPTVKSPNPENREAFDIAIEYAKEKGADLIFGTDPDSDRIGVVVKDKEGNFRVLTGNETGVLLCEYILRKTKENGMPRAPHVVKTIVTTEMVRAVADDYGVDTADVLTGFKYIGEKIAEYESRGESYLFGLEESYGYLKGIYARDKDAVVASMLVCELAADCYAEGITLSERLDALYEKYGYYREKLLSFTLKGIDGAERIKKIMSSLRTQPMGGEWLSRTDYAEGIDGLPPSDVLKFRLTDGSFTARPSGTEPKIKFYLSAKGKNDAECEKILAHLTEIVEEAVNR